MGPNVSTTASWLALDLLLPGVLTAVIAYFCGCFNGAVIVSKYILRDDVRGHGSGNAGLTNFHRAFGGPLTAVVLLLDVAKTVVAVLLGVLLFRAWNGGCLYLCCHDRLEHNPDGHPSHPVALLQT